MNIIKAFDRAFYRKNQKNWEKIYVLVDLHDTVLTGLYSGEEKYLWYDDALAALKEMTERKDVCLILWTASYPAKIREYQIKLAEHGIAFDFINENPEVRFTELFDGLGSGKLYFNVGIDDKFGFEPEFDWTRIYNYFKVMNDNDKAV